MNRVGKLVEGKSHNASKKKKKKSCVSSFVHCIFVDDLPFSLFRLNLFIEISVVQFTNFIYTKFNLKSKRIKCNFYH